MVSTLWPSPRDAKLLRMIRVLFRGVVLPAAALRGLVFFVALVEEVLFFIFAFAFFEFTVFALEETLREPLETALFEFLRGATFFRELFLLFLVFFLVAMSQVYHCGPLQFIFTVVGRHLSLARSPTPMGLRHCLTASPHR